jgi:hypothetical protein
VSRTRKGYQQLLFCEVHMPTSAGAEMRWSHRRGMMVSHAMCRRCGATIVLMKVGYWEADR